MNLFSLLCKQQRWSKETFPDADYESCLKHLEKELVEVRADPGDVMEWADLVILALGGAMRAGHTPYAICKAIEGKVAINMGRTWGEADEHGVREHVREV